MTTDPKTSVDVLLTRLDRVRSLARRLVRDAAEADDLVQEAVAAALSHPTAVEGEGDGWIATTLRNLVRDRARGARRRDVRERAAARPEGGVGDTSLLVENAERQRDVVEAVLALDDPYRETILMRFFEGLPPREIVRRTGRSSATVKKHIERGLAQVRQALEARYGGRGAWAVALLPVVGREGLGGLVGAGSGAALSSTPLRAAAVLLLMVGIGVPSYLIWRAASAGSEPDGSQVVGRVSAGGAEGAVEAVELASVGAATDSRVDHGDHSADTTYLEADVPATRPVTVRLLGITGAPYANASVEWSRPAIKGREVESEPRVFETDAAGCTTFDTSPLFNGRVGLWRVNGSRLAMAGVSERDGEIDLVLAPAVRIEGRVIDKRGQPLAGAGVTVWTNVARIPYSEFESDRMPDGHQFGTVTDSTGSYTLDAVPSGPMFRITAEFDDRWGGGVAIPVSDAFELDLVVSDTKTAVRWITGIVLDGGSAPSHAKVRFGSYEADVDARGRFKIRVPSSPLKESVSAQVTDGRFVVSASPVSSDVVAPSDAQGVVEDAIVLRIPAELQTLRGRLVDAEGESAAGFEVIVFDGACIGWQSDTFESGGFLGRVTTDGDGRFSFDRMQERPYTLRFLDRETMLVHDAGPLDPGPREHHIVLPDDGLIDVLRGHVVDLFGEPVRGAQITLRVDRNAEGAPVTGSEQGRTATTDQDGYFELENAPWRHLSIVVQPHASVGQSGVATPIGADRPDGVVELRLELKGRVRLTVASEDVTQVSAYDAEGERLRVVYYLSSTTIYHSRVKRMDAGLFPLFDVSQRATTLVLSGSEGEIDRIPVRLSATGVNEIQR